MAGGTNGNEGGEDAEAGSLSSLVAVGRALDDLSSVPSQQVPTPPMPPARLLQYTSRHATDGKFLFVDQRVTLALGFLPQELLGTSLYEYISASELGVVARTHKAALLRREAMHTPPYCFRRKDGSMARITTHFEPIRNPWTKEVECLVANNTAVTHSYTPPQMDPQSSYDIYKQSDEDANADSKASPYACDIAGGGLSEGDAEMQRLIDSQVESHKIGSAIAEEALRCSSTDFSSDLPADLLQDAMFNQQSSLVDNILGVEMGNYSQIRNNVTLGAAIGVESPPSAGASEGLSASSPPSPSPPLPSLGLDGNGEAAMAVIMSLLEADARLGGPVNFSGLPWPLP